MRITVIFTLFTSNILEIQQRLTKHLVHHPIPHQFHIGETSAYVLDDFQIIVRTILHFTVEQLDGHTILMLEKRIQQRPV
jgi:hypothetical protein